jgi:hypothetical protein
MPGYSEIGDRLSCQSSMAMTIIAGFMTCNRSMFSGHNKAAK